MKIIHLILCYFFISNITINAKKQIKKKINTKKQIKFKNKKPFIIKRFQKKNTPVFTTQKPFNKIEELKLLINNLTNLEIKIQKELDEITKIKNEKILQLNILENKEIMKNEKNPESNSITEITVNKQPVSLLVKTESLVISENNNQTEENDEEDESSEEDENNEVINLD